MCGHEAVGRHRRSPCAEEHMSGIPTGPATVTPPSLSIRAIAPSTPVLSTLCLLPLPQAASLCDLPEVISHLSPLQQPGALASPRHSGALRADCCRVMERTGRALWTFCPSSTRCKPSTGTLASTEAARRYPPWSSSAGRAPRRPSSTAPSRCDCLSATLPPSVVHHRLPSHELPAPIERERYCALCANAFRSAVEYRRRIGWMSSMKSRAERGGGHRRPPYCAPTAHGRKTAR